MTNCRHCFSTIFVAHTSVVYVLEENAKVFLVVINMTWNTREERKIQHICKNYQQISTLSENHGANNTNYCNLPLLQNLP